MNDRCEKCRFYYDASDGVREQGHCRRHAPRPAGKKSLDAEVWAIWPVVFPDEWCGEFMPQR
jgi:hypothetical protein